VAAVLASLASAAIIGAGARAITPATVTSAVESGLDGAGISLVAPGSWSERSALPPADLGLFDWLERHGHRFGVAPGPTAELPLIELGPDGDVPQRPLDPDLADRGALEVAYPAGGGDVATAAGGGVVRLRPHGEPAAADATGVVTPEVARGSDRPEPTPHGATLARTTLLEV
jgi:hypothetical protein